jgi:pimeloyl-ACP methyl ester carboxylesterase
MFRYGEFRQGDNIMTNFPVTESGTGRPALIIHGGGGPFTVASIAAHLSPAMHTYAPTIPGWNGVERPADVTRVGDVTSLFLDFLAERELTDVLVIGSSLGGWIAADMASLDTEHRISQVVVIDGAGVTIPGEELKDLSSLSPREFAEHAWHNADLGYRDPASIPPEQAAVQKANMQTMALLANDPYMHDPELLGRLGSVTIPALVIWGDSDRIFPPGYGRGLADGFVNGRFELVKDAGHLPHLEQPAATFALIDGFVTTS